MILLTRRDQLADRATPRQFLHYFTGDWTDSDKHFGTGWENGEFRSYQFVDGGNDDDDPASLVETNESRQRRVGTEIPLTETELMELRETAQP